MNKAFSLNKTCRLVAGGPTRRGPDSAEGSRAADLNASRIPPGLYTMPGYFVRQVRVNTWIVCFLSRHNGPIPRCMGDVGMTRCRDILDEFPLKNAVAA